MKNFAKFILISYIPAGLLFTFIPAKFIFSFLLIENSIFLILYFLKKLNRK